MNGTRLVKTTFQFDTWGTSPKEVAVVGEWGGWLALHDLKYCGQGSTWTADVNVPVGMQKFKFLIDGEWKVGNRYGIVDDGVGSCGNNFLEVSARVGSAALSWRLLGAWICDWRWWNR